MRASAAPEADGALVGRLAAGDEGALAALYDRHGRTLYALAYRILGDRDDAEEVVMEAFTQAWRGAGSYRPERGSVAAWLVVLARSRALDRRRSLERRSRAVDRAGGAEETPAMGQRLPEAHEAAEQGESRERVRAALAGLPEPQRVCIQLAYYDGLSQSEIAERLAEPLGTVKTRMRLGMAKLRDLLRPSLAERTA